jgi:hypothetical protein
MTDFLARVTPEVKLSTVTGRKDYANKTTARAETACGEEV